MVVVVVVWVVVGKTFFWSEGVKFDKGARWQEALWHLVYYWLWQTATTHPMTKKLTSAMSMYKLRAVRLSSSAPSSPTAAMASTNVYCSRTLEGVGWACGS